MATESIKQRIQALPGITSEKELRPLLLAILADLTDLRAKFNLLVTDADGLRTSHNTLATKLNADAGVTDTNYAAAPAATSAAVAAASLLA